MNDFTLDNVNEMYIDVLREIGNIGAGNATTSLASMINEQIDMNVPKVELMEASKLSSAICPEDEIIVGIFLEVTHDITGSMMFLMRMDSAHYLVNKLMGRDPENDKTVEANYVIKSNSSSCNKNTDCSKTDNTEGLTLDFGPTIELLPFFERSYTTAAH